MTDVLHKIDERLTAEVSSEKANTLKLATLLLMGLKFTEQTITDLYRGVMNMVLEDSSLIISAIARGKVEGIELGKVEGIELGRLQEVKTILLKQGTLKFGTPSEVTIEQIDSFTTLKSLEDLAERVLFADSWTSLLNC